MLSARAFIALVVLVVVQGLVEPVLYMSAIVLGTLVVAGMAPRATAIRLVAALVIAAAVMSPVYACYLRVHAANPDLAHQTPWPSPEPTWHEMTDLIRPMGS